MAKTIKINGIVGMGAETSLARIEGELKEAGQEPVVLAINSPGGDAVEGISIWSALTAHAPGVDEAIINGVAHSAASVIAMAAKKVKIRQMGRMMIHAPYKMTAGNAEDHQNAAETLASIENDMVKIYAKKTGKGEDEIKKHVKAGKVLTAMQAKEAGFVDEIINVMASFDEIFGCASEPEASEEQMPITQDEIAAYEKQGADKEKARIGSIMAEAKEMPGCDAIALSIIASGGGAIDFLRAASKKLNEDRAVKAQQLNDSLPPPAKSQPGQQESKKPMTDEEVIKAAYEKNINNLQGEGLLDSMTVLASLQPDHQVYGINILRKKLEA